MSDSQPAEAGPTADRSGRPGRVLQRGVRAMPGIRVPPRSVRAVARVARTDGRTVVLAFRIAGGEWCRPRRRIRFTTGQIARMRSAGVAEVVLRRFLRRTSMPLNWIG